MAAGPWLLGEAQTEYAILGEGERSGRGKENKLAGVNHLRNSVPTEASVGKTRAAGTWEPERDL